MGGLLSRWRRPSSTEQQLDDIKSQLAAIEEFKLSTQAFHRKLIGYMLAYFSVLYFFAAAVAYFKYFHHPLWQDLGSQLKLMAPFLVAPFIFLFVRRVLTWWYHRKIRRNEVKTANLLKRKETILDDAAEKMPFKKAKELFENHAPERLTNMGLVSKATPARPNPQTGAAGRSSSPQVGADGSQLRQRLNVSTTSAAAATPGSKRGPVAASAATAAGPSVQSAGSGGAPAFSQARGTVGPGRGTPGPGGPLPAGASPVPGRQIGRPAGVPGPPLPRPVLPRERGYMDRMVEYLVGDGPANRYALICKQCQSHNGMALKEEFEYIAYRCCYCYYWNPARKQRPVAPRLAGPVQRQSSTESSSEDDAASSNAKPLPPTETEGVSDTPTSQRGGGGDGGRSTLAQDKEATDSQTSSCSEDIEMMDTDDAATENAKTEPEGESS